MLPYDLIRKNGRQLKHCGRITEERNSLLWEKVQMHNVKKFKRSMKSWEEFMCWLRSKNIRTIKPLKQSVSGNGW